METCCGYGYEMVGKLCPLVQHQPAVCLQGRLEYLLLPLRWLHQGLRLQPGSHPAFAFGHATPASTFVYYSPGLLAPAVAGLLALHQIPAAPACMDCHGLVTVVELQPSWHNSKPCIAGQQQLAKAAAPGCRLLLDLTAIA